MIDDSLDLMDDEAFEASPLAPLDPFFAEGLIEDVLHVVKSGKEATVYCCAAHPSTGVARLAAKVYRARRDRTFRNDAVYHEGRYRRNTHERRAMVNKSAFGREVGFALWVEHEFAALRTLHAAGAAVPRPWRGTGEAILMEYIGDAESPAQPLHRVSPAPDEARRLFAELLRNVELWLRHNLVHADLSPYNILYLDGRLTVIDFPQAVDPRFNNRAYDLLARDLGHVCRYFARHGVRTDPARLTERLWLQWKFPG